MARKAITKDELEAIMGWASHVQNQAKQLHKNITEGEDLFLNDETAVIKALKSLADTAQKLGMAAAKRALILSDYENKMSKISREGRAYEK